MPSFAACTKLAERIVELSIRLATRSGPGLRTRALILVILVAVLAAQGAGYRPATAILLVLAAGLAGSRAAREFIAGGISAPPGSKGRPPA